MPGSLGEVSANDEDDEQNNDDNDNDEKKEKKKKKKKNRRGYGKDNENSEKVIQLVMPSSSKSRKWLSFKTKRKPILPKVCSSSSSFASGLWKGGCFCGMKPPETKESSSPISDPNDENFTHEMMRSLLETDDFCSKECNPHV